MFELSSNEVAQKMEYKEDFRNALKMGTTSLLLSGVSVSKVKGNKYINIFVNNWLFYFNIAWVQTDVLAQVFWMFEGFQNGTDLTELSLPAPCIGVCVLIEAKLACLFYNKSLLKEIIEKFKEIHPMITESTDLIKQGIVKESIKLITLTGSLLSMTFLSAAMCFNIAPIVIMLVNIINTGSTDFILPYKAKYYIKVNSIFVFGLLYIHEAVSTIISCINTTGVDATFYAFCTFIKMHFRLLSHRFENEIAYEYKNSNKHLIHLIIRHQAVTRLAQQLEQLFSKAVLIHIVSSSILICLSLFNMAFTDHIGNIITYFIFLTMNLTHIFLMCFFGDMLMTSSMRFSQSVYNFKWYNANILQKKIILFILMRSQIPCKITAAGFADLTMTTFTSILSTSWSYFALLRSMLQK